MSANLENSGLANLDSQGGQTAAIPTSHGETGGGNSGETLADVIASVRAERGISQPAAPVPAVADTKTEATPQEAAQEPVPAPTPSEEVAEELETAGGERVKVDGLKSVKEWGKGWEKTARSLQPLADIVQKRLGGDVEELQLAADVYDIVAGENFDPKAVHDSLRELSPARAEALENYFAGAVKDKAKVAAVRELFGESATSEEITQEYQAFKLFREHGGLAALLGEEGQDLPREVMFDEEGNRLPDSVVNFLREVKKTASQALGKANSQEQAEKQRQAAERQNAMAKQINTWTEERLEPVRSAAEQLHLVELPGDSEEMKQLKSDNYDVLHYAVLGKFQQDHGDIYRKAVQAITDGDKLAARKYGRAVERALSDVTAKVVERLGDSLRLKAESVKKQVATAKESRKEINSPGESTTGHVNNVQPERKTFGNKAGIEADIQRLIDQGLLRA
jgi:hypothetical protein